MDLATLALLSLALLAGVVPAIASRHGWSLLGGTTALARIDLALLSVTLARISASRGGRGLLGCLPCRESSIQAMRR